MENYPALTLYYHPLASFCHKVLVALYENGTPFEARFVDLADPGSSAEMLSFWPVGRFPVLRDERRGETVPETSIIIEYLDRHHPGPARLVPADPDRAREVRLWDRVFDLYVQAPMQRIVGDRLRPEERRDALGVEEARRALATAYEVIERQLAGKPWVCGDDFTMADCAAAPALFYADTVCPFSPTHPRLAAYFERLAARPSFARVLVAARPYFPNYPFRDRIPARFLDDRR